jgi:2,3-bisphosphoglycerate-independent phosphoglycerate mutase, archaeal form
VKYFVLIPDGAADYKIPELGMRTPFQAAKKPVVDSIARKSLVGTVSNVPQGMVPESDTANLAIMSYDPAVYSRGRSPLEAVSMGLTMNEGDIAFRCNVVTLTEDGDYEDKIILDHSADEITTPEAAELIRAVETAFSQPDRHFYPGVSYRHCMIWNSPPAYHDFMRPHDILGKRIGEYLPGEPYHSLMRDSFAILDRHPINQSRRARGLRPANSIWLWSPGGKPSLPSFAEKWDVSSAVISAVDLIKGIGICAGMRVIDVEGATGNIKTNFSGKAQAAIDAFRDGIQLVYVHVEAPDECGHRAEIENKVKSIELIDDKILRPVKAYLDGTGEEYKIMYLPDHPTPISMRTHSIDPVPFLLFSSSEEKDGVETFNEDTAAEKNNYYPHGSQLMGVFIK